ncbi:MAG: methyltransferase domain-containing protein [Fibrobacter sp.]|nr:methyltransferase domain-containing protein [Fibrobacter sp.]
MNENVAKQFGKHSETYDQVAEAQEELADGLFELSIPFLPDTLPSIFEIGCGTGFLSLQLASLFPERLDLLDISGQMLQKTQEKFRTFFPQMNYSLFQGDAETTDFPGMYDLIYSSATIQWFSNLKAFLKKTYEALNPQGKIFLGTFGKETARELARAYEKVMGAPLITGTNPCSENDLCRLTEKAGFKILDSATAFYTQHFDSPRHFLKSLSLMGVTGVPQKTPLTKTRLLELEAALKKENPTSSCTWELVILGAEKKG